MNCPKCHAVTADDSRFCSNCAAPLGPASPDGASLTRTLVTPPSALSRHALVAGKYRIIEELGRGGMGIVYKAEDIRLKRTVALKFLPPELTSVPEIEDRFMREARAAAALDHPNICTVYEFGKHEEKAFISMAFIEGQSLKKRIDPGPLEIEEALRIAAQVAEGLKEAHEKGIIHRDVKSANIMLTEKGQAKVMDFGLARTAERTLLTKEGTTMGTVAYMSPEQARGDEVDGRTDIWSLGVVLYEMLTGRLPFRSHHEQAVVYSILHEEAEPLRASNPDVPPALERIIQKMLAKDPSGRYADMAGLLEGITTVQRGKEPRSRVTETVRAFASKPVFLIPAVLFVLGMLAAGYLAFKHGIKSGTASTGHPRLPSLAVVSFENKSGDVRLDNWRDALPELLTTDLSQSKFLRVLRSDQLYGIYKKLDLLEAVKYTDQDLRDIAGNGGVDHIVKGSYFKAGDQLVITAMLIHARSGETVSSLSLDAEGEKAIFSTVDKLTREIKARLNITPAQLAGDIDKEVDIISTSSFEALTHYMEGRHHHYEGNFLESVRSMERALSFDPGFAMAYRAMTWSYYHLGLVSEQMRSLKKAMELSENLPVLERHVIEADYYRFNRKPGETHDRALESIEKALQLYPDNPLANGKLIELCAAVEDWDRALDRFEFIKEKKLSSHFDYHYIGIFYCAKGMIDNAIKSLHFYIDQIEESFAVRWTLALVYAIPHKFDLSLSEIDRASSTAPTMHWIWTTKAAIHLFREEFPEVERIRHRLMNHEDRNAQLDGRKIAGLLALLQGRLTDAEAHFEEGKAAAKKLGIQWEQSRFVSLLGYVHFIKGNYEEALVEFDEEIKIYGESDWEERMIRARYMKALALLGQNSLEGLQEAEADLLKWVKIAFNKKLERYHLNYLGRKELGRHHVPEAIAQFDRALALLPHERPPWERLDDIPQVLFIEPLARAYLETGDLEKAQAEQEKISGMTWGRLFYGDLYALSFYHLGGIYRQKGWEGKSIESYQKFIDLWKDSDPVFQPLVEDARTRIKELRGDPS